ncbi:hypothetical protein R3P38DRAFT_3202054 [Favolaschia claudopus]|uniref:Uncharacterized protein n=1 Tax=Favolaschia claudopus TaxID=2862362 RepID=A0AAW0AUP4_9AGAR
MDPAFCSGLTPKGDQCRCRRFVSRADDDIHCTCAHVEGYHPGLPAPSTTQSHPPPATHPPPPPPPPPPITASSIVASYLTPSQLLSDRGATRTASTTVPLSQPIASSSRLKHDAQPTISSSTAVAAAVAETRHGLKRKSDPPLDDRPTKKKRKSSKSRGDGTIVKMGEVIVLPMAALNEARTLFTTPRAPMIAHLESRQLAVNGLRTTLQFSTLNTREEMDAWFRINFPTLFSYLDRYFAGETHWRLLIRSGSTLTASPNNVDGAEAKRYLAQKQDDRKIFLATTREISAEVWDHDDGWHMDVSPVLDSSSESDTYSLEDSDSDGSWHNYHLDPSP